MQRISRASGNKSELQNRLKAARLFEAQHGEDEDKGEKEETDDDDDRDENLHVQVLLINISRC